jgi:hypothetical protein
MIFRKTGQEGQGGRIFLEVEVPETVGDGRFRKPKGFEGPGAKKSRLPALLLQQGEDILFQKIL